MRAGVVGRDDPQQHVAQVARDGAFVDGMGDLAVFHPEARGAARIVPRRRVDRRADQRGDQQPGAHVADQIGAADGALRQVDVGGGGRGRRARAARGAGGAGIPSLRAVARSSVQPVSMPFSTMARAAVGSPSASNGREPGMRGRSGSSITDRCAGSTCLPSTSRTQEAPRAMALPLTAPADGRSAKWRPVRQTAPDRCRSSACARPAAAGRVRRRVCRPLRLRACRPGRCGFPPPSPAPSRCRFR